MGPIPSITEVSAYSPQHRIAPVIACPNFTDAEKDALILALFDAAQGLPVDYRHKPRPRSRWGDHRKAVQ